jgi:hypothetical protein
MMFLWIQERTESWITVLRRLLSELTRTGGENRRGKEDTLINPDGLSMADLGGTKRSGASRKTGKYEPSQSPAEIALWQLLLL